MPVLGAVEIFHSVADMESTLFVLLQRDAHVVDRKNRSIVLAWDGGIGIAERQLGANPRVGTGEPRPGIEVVV